MSLRELIADDVADVFLNTDDFAETATLIAADGRESDVTAVIQDEEAPLEDNRAQRRRVEKCVAWLPVAEAEEGQPLAIDHADGPIVIQTRLALRRDGDARRLWDFEQQVSRDHGMVGLRFQRVSAEEVGEITPGLGR